MKSINAEEAIKEILDVYEYEYPTASGAFDHFVTHMVPNILRNLTTADEEPVRHGRWIRQKLTGCEAFYLCSVCRKLHDQDYNYCNNCGAKMDEGVQ